MYHKPDRAIDSVISNQKYTNYVYGLHSNNEDIKKHLGFGNDFWNFTKDNIREVMDYGEIDLDIYRVTPILDKEGKIANVYGIVPKVVDYQSAMIAIDVYTKAYNYYLNIGKHLNEVNINIDTNNKKEAYMNILKK